MTPKCYENRQSLESGSRGPEKYTSEPDKALMRRYENGEVKGTFRTPSACVLHRADLQRALYEAANAAGATVLFRKAGHRPHCRRTTVLSLRMDPML